MWTSIRWMRRRVIQDSKQWLPHISKYDFKTFSSKQQCYHVSPFQCAFQKNQHATLWLAVWNCYCTAVHHIAADQTSINNCSAAGSTWNIVQVCANFIAAAVIFAKLKPLNAEKYADRGDADWRASASAKLQRRIKIAEDHNKSCNNYSVS